MFTLKTTSQDDLGLKWEIFNSSQPLVGDEIDNATLAAALEQQYNDNKQNPEILPENAGFLSLSRDELAAMEVEHRGKLNEAITAAHSSESSALALASKAADQEKAAALTALATESMASQAKALASAAAFRSRTAKSTLTEEG